MHRRKKETYAPHDAERRTMDHAAAPSAPDSPSALCPKHSPRPRPVSRATRTTIQPAALPRQHMRSPGEPDSDTRVAGGQQQGEQTPRPSGTS